MELPDRSIDGRDSAGMSMHSVKLFKCNGGLDAQVRPHSRRYIPWPVQNILSSEGWGFQEALRAQRESSA